MEKNKDNYSKFIEAMSERKYTSMMDEYKRSIHGKAKEYIFATPKEVIEEIVKTTLKTDNVSNVFEGLEFETPGAGKSYVNSYVEGVQFSVLFKTKSDVVGNQYHTYEYVAKSLKDKYTKLYFTHVIKSDMSVLGLNGKLGLMKFKKEHRKQADGIFKYLKNKLDEK